MSATITWRPLTDAQNVLQCGASSSFMETMREVFGQEPWHLGPRDVKTLRAMAAVKGFGSDGFANLADVIERLEGDVAVEVSW